MGNSLRRQPEASRFGTLQTPVTEDVLQIGLAFAFGIIAFSFIIIIPGIRGWERLWATIRVLTAIFIASIIISCNFGSWYGDRICTRTQYKAHTKPNAANLIQATVGVSISLRGMNITLREELDGCGSEEYVRPFPGEEINFVESYSWENWRQGILDFGEFGEQFRMEYRAQQFRGLPYPIIWVAEPMLFDEDQYRWFRRFRVAGWYTHIWLWTAFATYLASIILFIFNIRQGAYFMFLTGAMMCLAALTYSVMIQNDPPLQVRFPNAVLRPNFNYSFYLTLLTGVFTLVASIVILIMDILWPRKIAAFFHHSLTEDDAIFEGELEEEEGESGIVRQPSKVSYKGAEGKIRRKGTITHLRDSIRSNRSLRGRGDVLPRERSQAALNIPEASGSSPSSQQKLLGESGQANVEIELEAVVHKNAQAV